MLANATTDLSSNDVFYFGNAIGEMNAGNVGTPITVRVNATDTSIVRQNQSSQIMRYFSAPASFLANGYLANYNPSLSVPSESSEVIREGEREVWWTDEKGSLRVMIASARAQRKS